MGFAEAIALADRSALAHLGGAVTYESSLGESVAVRGIFDEAYALVEAGQVGVSSTAPAAFLLLADLPSNPSEDSPAITIAGVEYEVREAKPDGLGGVLLILHEV